MLPINSVACLGTNVVRIKVCMTVFSGVLSSWGLLHSDWLLPYHVIDNYHKVDLTSTVLDAHTVQDAPLHAGGGVNTRLGKENWWVIKESSVNSHCSSKRQSEEAEAGFISTHSGPWGCTYISSTQAVSWRHYLKVLLLRFAVGSLRERDSSMFYPVMANLISDSAFKITSQDTDTMSQFRFGHVSHCQFCDLTCVSLSFSLPC